MVENKKPNPKLTFDRMFAEVTCSNGNITRKHLAKFWGTLAGKYPGCEKMCGIYILAVKPRREWKPLYVGLTMKSFKARLNRHSDAGSFRRFLSETKPRKLGFYLLAAKAPPTASTEDAIEALEIACVAICIRHNSKLFNKMLTKEKFAIEKTKNGTPKVPWVP